MGHWLRLLLLMQRAQVRPLVWELDPTCRNKDPVSGCPDTGFASLIFLVEMPSAFDLTLWLMATWPQPPDMGSKVKTHSPAWQRSV